MKRILTISAVVLLGIGFATPAVAGHYAHRGGHHRIVRGATLGIGAFPGPRLPVPRFHSSFSLSLGFPPVPFPVVAPPVAIYYAPRPVVVAPPYERVWIPAGYVWDGGAQYYVGGHWSYHRCHDGDD